jgi:[ribosomal protein S5]-alanine N-acetyltransferase
VDDTCGRDARDALPAGRYNPRRVLKSLVGPRRSAPVMRSPRLDLPINSPRLVLRLPTAADAPDYLWILTSKPVARLMLYRGPPLTLEGVKRTIATRRLEARKGVRYDLTVELRTIGRVVGRAALKRINPKTRRAEIAYWLGPDYWGAGLATEAVYTLCRAGFERLHLHRIDAGVFKFNRRSIALLERLGFRQEGALRDAVRYRRRWVPELRYGLLNGELRVPK